MSPDEKLEAEALLRELSTYNGGIPRIPYKASDPRGQLIERYLKETGWTSKDPLPFQNYDAWMMNIGWLSIAVLGLTLLLGTLL